MTEINISPLFFGEFTQSDQLQLRLGYGLLIDFPEDGSLSNIKTLMHFSRGMFNNLLVTPGALDFNSQPPRIVFAYCLNDEINAHASRVLTGSPKHTYLVTINTGLVKELSQSASEIVFRLSSLLFQRPFLLPKDQTALDQFGFAVSALAIQTAFLHEFAHCTRNHLNVWRKLSMAGDINAMSERLNSADSQLLKFSGVKTRIRRALEFDADIKASTILGTLYHHHVVGPDAGWFGKLTERHKLIACWLSVISVGVALCKINNQDSDYYHSPFMRSLGMAFTIFNSTRTNAEDIEELNEDLHLFLSVLNDAQHDSETSLIPSEDYVNALPTIEQLQTSRDLERLKKFGQIRDA